MLDDCFWNRQSLVHRDEKLFFYRGKDCYTVKLLRCEIATL